MQSESRIAKGLKAPALFAIACLFSAHAASAQSLARDGFWKGQDNPDREYARFLKIEGDKGFYCVLDGKSSFAFRIVGDSITTPLNGMDHIRFFSGLPDVVISGEEKGEAYSNRFVPLGAETYPAVCVEEEEAEGASGIARRADGIGRSAPSSSGRLYIFGVRDALGRISAPSPIP